MTGHRITKQIQYKARRKRMMRKVQEMVGIRKPIGEFTEVLKAHCMEKNLEREGRRKKGPRSRCKRLR